MIRGWLIAAPAVAAWALAGNAAAQDAENLLEMSIEELGQLEVTSVSRRAESLNDAPASVHVITREEILRSGVKTIAEALRLAPGVEVARNSSHSWTISLRGFSSDLSNKLLVLIDGRSVYSPLFAGVFWDVQDTLLEDIDRIEIIAGPGGTLWGANAVNGVINIITRSAWDTSGGLLEVGGGNEQEAFAALRYAGRPREDLAARGYVKHFERDASRTLAGSAGIDDWSMTQAGFRLDWAPTATDALTVQGDVYGGDESALVRGDFTLGTLPDEGPGTIDVGGGNVLARWERELDGGATLRLQTYFDHTDRDIPGTYHEKRDTADVDFQHHLRLYGRHDLIWGAGFRASGDDIDNTTFARFDPPERTDRTYSVFLQDRIDLKDGRLFLTLGSKLEHNDYSGFEHQPSARLSWLLTPRQTLWGAVSRAVRIPARLNEDLELTAPVQVPGFDLPLYVNVLGSRDFEPEELLAREVGYRIGVRDDLSLDFALFQHDYDKLFTNEGGSPEVMPGPPPYIVVPVRQGNGLYGETYGGTVAANWQPMPRWRLELNYSYLQFDLGLRPGSSDDGGPNVAGNSPEHQAAAHSYVELPRDFSLYVGVRYVDDLPNQNVPEYAAVDVSLDWRPSRQLRTALTVQNANDERHLEFGEGNAIERSAHLTLDWRF